MSRSAASQIREAIAEAIGMDDEELAAKLADAHLDNEKDDEFQQRQMRRLLQAYAPTGGQLMNFIQSSRADASQPINLDHVVTFKKERVGSAKMIVFEMSNGKMIYWKYPVGTTTRDSDYEQLTKELREGNS